jgi:beta-lactamase class A
VKISIRPALILVFAVSISGRAADLSILKAQIEKTIPRARGEVGVAIKHLESGSEVLVNADARYPMASAFKLPILVELYYQKAAGKLSLDDRIDVMPDDLHIGSGVMIALFDPPGVQLNIRNLVNMMMRISDNSAADLLINKVGLTNVTNRMKALGLDSIRVDRTTQEMILDQSGLDYATYGARPVREVRKLLDAIDAPTAARANEQFNRTEKDVAKPSDLNRILEKLYAGQIVDRTTSDEIIDILKECQTGPARIPGLVPADTVIAHKTGTIGGSINDTGIVFLPYDAGHIAITVLMKDARASTAERERVIAEITRYAYDYFVFNYGKP